jgi:GNAT superfamily N-acetyltransferase
VTTPDVEGFTVTRLGADDAPALQDLFERASEFFELCEGGPPRDDAALKELTHVPDGFTADDLFAFGFARETIDAVVELLRDRRVDGGWWIGLLLVDPSSRNAGVGRRIFDATRAWLQMQGARTIYIGVVTANEKALRFWHARGFVDTGVQPYTSAYGHTTDVMVMKAPVASTPAQT